MKSPIFGYYYNYINFHLDGHIKVIVFRMLPEITIDFNTPTCHSIVDLRRIKLNTSTTIRTQLTNFIQAKDKITKHNRNLLTIPNLRPYNTPTINQDTNRLLLSIIDPLPQTDLHKLPPNYL